MAEPILALPPGQGSAYAAVCAALHEQAFAEPWDAATFATLLGDPTVHCWIGHDDDGHPTALLLCRVVIDESEVLTVGTQPSARRAGWGRKILDHAKNDLQARGVTQCFLEVAEDNHPAQALYQSCGYTQVGLRKAYYAPHSEGEPRRNALVLAVSWGP